MTTKQMQVSTLALAMIVVGCEPKQSPPTVEVEPTPPTGLHYLDQGWNDAEREKYYHYSMGSQLLPLGWVLALEAADSQQPFMTKDSVLGFGFIPAAKSEHNPYGLPVGFATDVNSQNAVEFLGFTCAACHTRDIEYGEATVRIDGAPATQNLQLFQVGAVQAFGATLKDPGKSERFAKNVLGDKYGEESAKQLMGQVGQVVQQLMAASVLPGTDPPQPILPVEEGFGRIDALGREGNFLVAQLGLGDQVVVADAPVRFPFIWDTPKFNWVEYMNGIRQPLARNSSVALGVFTPIKVTGDPNNLDSYWSDVRFDNLVWMEGAVAKLVSPKWPEEILGSIDQEKARHGQELYAASCASCHVLPGDVEKDADGRWVIDLYPVEEIGTDPKVVQNFNERTVDTGALGLGTLSADAVFQFITEKVAQKYFKDNQIPPEKQKEMEGGVPNEWQAPLAYRARPLNGIWAVGPYLHNGSVPNLYQLLQPADQRDKTFHAGNLKFDPKHVGYESSTGPFKMDTSIAGNSNVGHEYGTSLTDDERWNLIEYLKTL